MPEQKEFFKNNVKMVEIETHSFCNRKCWFCPNSIIDRVLNKEYMPEPIYLKVIKELSEITYSETISFSRYNEPLADRGILKRIEQARTFLPDAKLHTNTNGDYLSKEYIEELAIAGLNSLNVQIYLNNDEEYSNELVKKHMDKKLEKLGIAGFEVFKDKEDVFYGVKKEYKGLQIQLYGRNFATTGTDRGGLIPQIKHRIMKTNCYRPFTDVYIDYNGSCMPCCNLRSDAPEHKDYIVGNIGQNTIFEIFSGEKLTEWRDFLTNYGATRPPCDTCSFR